MDKVDNSQDEPQCVSDSLYIQSALTSQASVKSGSA